MTTATLLTPPGTAAIAVIAVEGPGAQEVVGKLFSKSLPKVGRFRYGKLCGDDVIVACFPARIEIHCHGGRAVVQLILDQLACPPKLTGGHRWAGLTQAKTLRVASILLDQMNGAFAREVTGILEDFNLERLQLLNQYSPLGRHLTSPWRIAIAGRPNVGKSSLINALLGFDRAVVSPIAGTTRDVVASSAAFAGWPVELLDTAGLRDTTDELESLGIERARSVLQSADLVVWVHDATDPGSPSEWPGSLAIANKCDLAPAPPGMPAVSAKTGDGVAALIGTLVRKLVPHAPPPGAAVPFTPDLAVTVSQACAAATTGNIEEARRLLTAGLSGC